MQKLFFTRSKSLGCAWNVLLVWTPERYDLALYLVQYNSNRFQTLSKRLDGGISLRIAKTLFDSRTPLPGSDAVEEITNDRSPETVEMINFPFHPMLQYFSKLVPNSSFQNFSKNRQSSKRSFCRVASPFWYAHLSLRSLLKLQKKTTETP